MIEANNFIDALRFLGILAAYLLSIIPRLKQWLYDTSALSGFD
jgi:hypothetical protein